MTKIDSALLESLEKDYFDDVRVMALVNCFRSAQSEPVAWRTFDGEGGYDYRTYEDNEDYAAKWAKRNPWHVNWVEPLFTVAQSIIQPEIKDDKEPRLLPWKGLTEEEHTYYKGCGFVGVKAVEEKLRARNSTLVCHQGEEGK